MVAGVSPNGGTGWRTNSGIAVVAGYALAAIFVVSWSVETLLWPLLWRESHFYTPASIGLPMFLPALGCFIYGLAKGQGTLRWFAIAGFGVVTAPLVAGSRIPSLSWVKMMHLEARRQLRTHPAEYEATAQRLLATGIEGEHRLSGASRSLSMDGTAYVSREGDVSVRFPMYKFGLFSSCDLLFYVKGKPGGEEAASGLGGGWYLVDVFE